MQPGWDTCRSGSSPFQTVLPEKAGLIPESGQMGNRHGGNIFTSSQHHRVTAVVGQKGRAALPAGLSPFILMMKLAVSLGDDNTTDHNSHGKQYFPGPNKAPHTFQRQLQAWSADCSRCPSSTGAVSAYLACSVNLWKTDCGLMTEGANLILKARHSSA